MSLVDTKTGAVASLDGRELDTNIEIQMIRFNPLNISGSLSEVLKNGDDQNYGENS